MKCKSSHLKHELELQCVLKGDGDEKCEKPMTKMDLKTGEQMSVLLNYDQQIWERAFSFRKKTPRHCVVSDEHWIRQDFSLKTQR